MLDVLDKLIVRESVAALPRPERALAELLMSGHSQASAARELGIDVRTVRYRMQLIRRGFSRGVPADEWAEGDFACPPRPSAL